MGRMCTRQLLLDKLHTKIHILFVSAPQVTPIGGTVIDIKSILQLQEQLCKRKKIAVVVAKMGLNHHTMTQVVLCKHTLRHLTNLRTIKSSMNRPVNNHYTEASTNQCFNIELRHKAEKWVFFAQNQQQLHKPYASSIHSSKFPSCKHSNTIPATPPHSCLVRSSF